MSRLLPCWLQIWYRYLDGLELRFLAMSGSVDFWFESLIRPDYDPWPGCTDLVNVYDLCDWAFFAKPALCMPHTKNEPYILFKTLTQRSETFFSQLFGFSGSTIHYITVNNPSPLSLTRRQQRVASHKAIVIKDLSE